MYIDLYGKIIICSRILNAVILWSLCALPFAKLDAIVLLCTMVGSLLFQGKFWMIFITHKHTKYWTIT